MTFCIVFLRYATEYGDYWEISIPVNCLTSFNKPLLCSEFGSVKILFIKSLIICDL